MVPGSAVMKEEGTQSRQSPAAARMLSTVPP
jgi:hypothetical protein